MNGTCETCRYWEPLAYEQMKYGGVPESAADARWGTCRMVGEGAGHYASDFDEFKSERAFTRDASDYQSWLTTRADFGCVEYAVTIGDAGAPSVSADQAGQASGGLGREQQ